MTRALCLIALVPLLAACGTTTSGREACAANLDAAWTAMNTAQVDGFAGSVSYAKAVGLITSAKTQQALGNYERCDDEARRASFFVEEARKGR